MSLFAAYAEVPETQSTSTEKTTLNEAENNTWLTNSSFKIDVKPFQPEDFPQLHPKHYDNSLSSCSDNQSDKDIKESRKRKKIKKKSKKSHKSKKKEQTNDTTNIEQELAEYLIDKKRITEYKYVNTIARPMAPRYHIYKYINIPRNKKIRKFKRYYQVIIEKHVTGSNSEEEKLTQKDIDNASTLGEKNPAFKGFEQEEDMSRQTANYNRDLQIDPYNIDMWIKYVNFQDTVFNFEKSYRKGSIAKGQRVTAERKLSILDKAIQYNPDCVALLRLRLNIAVSVFPADELQAQLGKLVERDAGNIILWQGYIEATQCSMSHCTTPAVINLYIKCLHTLHTIRRTAKVNRALLEESILRMLYQCGLFLKQAGLFEQLWTLLRMYLELNLSDSRSSPPFSTTVTTDEQQLVELEEVVLKSQLPIHELWLRVEKLREASHWLPVNQAQCEDPQRLVFSEDVSELIHPITMPGNTFRLTVTILTLLKIPLLPCRHTTMKQFGIDYVPWSLDSVETLLSIFLPLYPIDISNKLLLIFTQKLAVGPQYLKTLPGQEEYLQFILTVMQSCISCLSNREKTALTVWWFRFLRLLTVLQKQSLFKVTSIFRKKLRSDMKNMLKENSSNVILFKEYALVEYENNFDSSVNILKTAINMSCSKPLLLIDVHDQGPIISTLKTLVELHIFKDKDIQKETKLTCLKYICSVILGNFKITELPRFITQAVINEAKEKFVEVHVNSNTTETDNNLESVDHFLPNYTTDWIILHGYFLFLNDSFTECRVFIENVLNKWDLEGNMEETEQNNTDGTKSEGKKDSRNNMDILLKKEILYEFLVALLYKTCVDVPGSGLFPMLDKYLENGIQLFPNNLFFLATLSKVQSFYSNYGQPWWKIQNLLMKSGHALSTLFLVLIANQRICDIETNWIDTVTGQVISTDNSFKNRMLNLFKRITRSDMCTRRCGLVWRLYLQFLHAYFEPKSCRAAYYMAVEECPWLKALYIDAAIYIPEDLAQIQDLIIEKQLRIHVTPEELEVLRT